MRIAIAATRAAENEDEREDRLEQKRVAAAAFRAAENKEEREDWLEQKRIAAATFRAAENEENRGNRVEQKKQKLKSRGKYDTKSTDRHEVSVGAKASSNWSEIRAKPGTAASYIILGATRELFTEVKAYSTITN